MTKSRDVELLLVAKPIYIWCQALWYALPNSLLALSWIVAIVTVAYSFFSPHGLRAMPRLDFIIVGLISTLILLQLIIAYWLQLTYKCLSYNFYPLHLEFTSGLLSRNKEVIKYSNMIEVTYRQSLIQRFFNIGTIHISTQNGKLALRDIGKVEDTYNFIKSKTLG